VLFINDVCVSCLCSNAPLAVLPALYPVQTVALSAPANYFAVFVTCSELSSYVRISNSEIMVLLVSHMPSGRCTWHLVMPALLLLHDCISLKSSASSLETCERYRYIATVFVLFCQPGVNFCYNPAAQVLSALNAACLLLLIIVWRACWC
jgi:hypothetical protein